MSDIPADVRAIVEAATLELARELQVAHDRSLALPGDPAERENDAVSTTSEFAAVAGIKAVSRLMVAKGTDVATTWPLIVIDIQTRMQAILRATLRKVGQ